MLKRFPFYEQPDRMDCGPTCLRMISKYYGRTISLQMLRDISETTREGSSLKNLANAAEKIGFRTIGVKINFEKFQIFLFGHIFFGENYRFHLPV